MIIIFPAYAGLNLKHMIGLQADLYIPRIRGVEPEFYEQKAKIEEYSPHTRG